MKDKHFWYWLVNIEGVGRGTILKLLKEFKTPKAIYEASENEVKPYLKPSQLTNFLLSKKDEQIMEGFRSMEEKGVNFLYPTQAEYPRKLKEIYDYPLGLYYTGKLPKNEGKSIAIVGSRNCSPYGREMAYYFGRELAKQGVEVISGFAAGVDSMAHKGALEASGSTIGVLGCGIDICYPIDNIHLYREMKEKAGLLSEYGLKVQPRRQLFPMRNRIISGLCDGVLVVEAKAKSGSLITADQGLEQGRDIFALPGRRGDVHSEGCNNLIKMGAKLVTEVEDILEEWGIFTENKEKICEKTQHLLDKKDKMVYSCLSLEPKYIDAIVKECKLSVQETISILFRLEMENKIKQIVKNYYMITV